MYSIEIDEELSFAQCMVFSEEVDVEVHIASWARYLPCRHGRVNLKEEITTICYSDNHYLRKWLSMACVQGLYDVNEASSYLLATKPWRVITCQQHKQNIAIYIRRLYGRGSYDRSIALLQNLTADARLAESIYSLHYNKAVEFNQLHVILCRLHNIIDLRVQFIIGLDSRIEKICQILNQFRRLRSLEIKQVFLSIFNGANSMSPGAILLFGRMRHASIAMITPDISHIATTRYEYRELNMDFREYRKQTLFAHKWNEFVQLCPKLSHLCIEGVDQTCRKPSIPSNLLSLEIHGDFDVVAQLQRSNTQLRTLALAHICNLNFAEMVACCPHIINLKLTWIDIRGRITGLPLVTLQLTFPTCDSYGACARHMCTKPLSRLETQTSILPSFGEFEDWIANPEFIVGSYVVIRDGKWDRGKMLRSKKRVYLFLQEVMLRHGLR